MGNFGVRAPLGMLCLFVIFVLVAMNFARYLFRKESFIGTVIVHIIITILLLAGSINLTFPAILELQSEFSNKTVELTTISNIHRKKMHPLSLVIYQATTSNGDTMYILDSHFERKINNSIQSQYSGRITYCKTLIGKSIINFD